MRKLTTKLLMSIIAVAFAFVALGTSTYAWFAMNTTVTANSMQVTAKSNAQYLLIGAENIATDKTKAGTAKPAAYATTDNNEKAVYPAAYTTDAIKNGDDTLVEAGNWYTASNKNTNNPTDAVFNYQKIDLTKTNYFLEYHVWLSLSEDSEPTNNQKIQVNFSKQAKDDAAVSAYVTFGEGESKEEFWLNSTHNTGKTSSAISLSSTTSVEVTIYLYIDGTSANVYSEYINGTTAKAITGNVSVSFDLVAAD